MSKKRKRPDPVLAGEVGSAKAHEEFEQSLDPARSPGRPPGAKNLDVEEIEGELTRCPKCGSTERGPYFNRRDLPIRGNHLVTGLPYTSIVVRRCQCLGCGQHRDDKHYLNHRKK